MTAREGLATLLRKPESPSARRADALTRSTTFAQIADWLNAFVIARYAEREVLRQKWMKDKNPWAARAGWHLAASRINVGDDDDHDLPSLLDRIEQALHRARPEVPRTMNNTLGAIGIRHAAVRARAASFGERIGLYRNWPVAKGCTPPYVPVWVEALVKHPS